MLVQMKANKTIPVMEGGEMWREESDKRKDREDMGMEVLPDDRIK